MKKQGLLNALILVSGTIAPAHARYYDAGPGRFIGPDPTATSPSDPQSVNRFSYARNTPLNLTDPAGHSWMSSAVQRTGHWVRQHREFTGLVWQTFDPFFGSAYLASFKNGRAILAGEIVAAGSFGVGGTEVGWGAVSGELSSAYTAHRSGGDMMKAIVGGGLGGAALAATFEGISTSNTPWIAKGLAKSAIGAAVTAARGGDAKSVEMAAALTFASEAADSYFKRTVGYEADPTPGTPLENSDHTYPYSDIQPPAGKDVFGDNTPEEAGFLHQGSAAMRTASSLPGMQAVSQLHDTWMNTQHMSGMYLLGNEAVANAMTMPAAFVVSYAAELSGPWAPSIILLQR